MHGWCACTSRRAPCWFAPPAGAEVQCWPRAALRDTIPPVMWRHEAAGAIVAQRSSCQLRHTNRRGGRDAGLDNLLPAATSSQWCMPGELHVARCNRHALGLRRRQWGCASRALGAAAPQVAPAHLCVAGSHMCSWWRPAACMDVREKVRVCVRARASVACRQHTFVCMTDANL
jgi:hypothetical protein